MRHRNRWNGVKRLEDIILICLKDLVDGGNHCISWYVRFSVTPCHQIIRPVGEHVLLEMKSGQITSIQVQ